MLSLVLVVTITGCEDEIVIKKTENIETIEVKYDTSKKEIINKKLPEKIEVILTDGNTEKTRNTKVAWSAVDEYHSYIPDTYTFKGAFKIDDTRGVKYVDVKVKPEQNLTKNRISDFEIDVTGKAEELEFQIKAYSEEGIKNVEIKTSEEEIIKEYSGQKNISFSGIIKGNPGTESNINVPEIEALVTTSSGSKFSKTKSNYVKKYDAFEIKNGPEVGIFYWPYMFQGHWEEGAVGRSLLGEYSTGHPSGFDKHIVNRHIDQMQTAGIDRLMLLIGQHEQKDYDRLEAIKEIEMFSEIDHFEIYYDLAKALKWDHNIERDLKYYRDNAFTLNNYNKINGRPIIYFWGASTLYWDKEIRKEVQNKYGSLENFVGKMREILTVSGVEPYMVGDFQIIGKRYIEYNKELPEFLIKLIGSFDGITTWTGYNPADKTFSWDKQHEFVKKNFKGYEELIDRNNLDVDLAPGVFPGFDDRGNEEEGWGMDRLTPPSPEYFSKLLELADEYKTIPHINIISWNEWCEGHMIEPGYYDDYKAYPDYNDSYYGFDYLKEIKEFLK